MTERVRQQPKINGGLCYHVYVDISNKSQRFWKFCVYAKNDYFVTYSTANKIFAFLAGNDSAGLSAERPLPARAGHLWYSHLLSRWRHL